MTSVRSCRDVIRFLNLYLDRALPAPRRIALKAHLLLCRDCRRYLRSYELTIRAARAAFDAADSVEPLDRDLIEGLLRAALASRRLPPR